MAVGRGRPKKIVKMDAPTKVYKCFCCGAETESPAGKFYKSNASQLWSQNDNYYPICKVCLTNRFNEFIHRYDMRTAMIIMCHYLDLPFFGAVFESLAAKKDSFTIGEYSRIVTGQTQYNNKTFAYSIANGDVTQSGEAVRQEQEVKWEKQDLRNKKFVIERYGYDPFDDSNYDEADRKYLYNTLSGYVDDDEDDAHKRMSALNLVTTSLQRSKIDRLINAELLSSAPTADLKIYAETKDKFDRIINAIANDNGFSAKAMGKNAQKNNSLTRIMKEMIDSDFEDCKANSVDSKMKGVYRQMAEISNKNLFDQLNFQADDYARMVAEQREMIQKYEFSNMELEEQNRKLRIMVKQMGGEKFLSSIDSGEYLGKTGAK